MTTSGDLDQAEELLLLGITEAEHARRLHASQDLAGMGIDPASPSDIEHWLAMSPKEQRKISERWLVYQVSYKNYIKGK